MLKNFCCNQDMSKPALDTNNPEMSKSVFPNPNYMSEYNPTLRLLSEADSTKAPEQAFLDAVREQIKAENDAAIPEMVFKKLSVANLNQVKKHLKAATVEIDGEAKIRPAARKQLEIVEKVINLKKANAESAQKTLHKS